MCEGHRKSRRDLTDLSCISVFSISFGESLIHYTNTSVDKLEGFV